MANGFYLKAQGLAVGYRGKPVLQGVDLQVRKGEILTLIGPNGVGKSTVLRSLARQLQLLGGRVWLGGRPMEQLSGPQLARTLSAMMTGSAAPERMRCGEVVAHGRYPYTGRLGILGAQDWAAVREAMQLVGALELMEADFAQVSDGQRQRVLLARAICQQPDVMLLDEPTSFLDLRYKLELLGCLRQLVRQKQIAVVLSLHELDLAQRISDQVLCVRAGRAERCGPPEEIFAGEYIRQLYGVTGGSYNALLGQLELPPVQGAPQVFVIGGGGSGIAAYHRLQRQGVPFAAGILPQNDLDYPTASALASALVATPPYTLPDGQAFTRAAALLAQCARCECCVQQFGPVNEANRRLAQLACRQGKLPGRV